MRMQYVPTAVGGAQRARDEERLLLRREPAALARPRLGALATSIVNLAQDRAGRAAVQSPLCPTTSNWSFEPWGPPGFYLIDTGKEPSGAIRGALQERRELVRGQKMVGFECTISVADIDQAIRAIEARGGRIAAPKSDIRRWEPWPTSSIRRATSPR
jgi:hypothetical protein